MAKEVIVINTSQIKFSRPEVNDEQPKKKFLLLFNCIDNEEGLSVPHSSKYGDSFVACV